MISCFCKTSLRRSPLDTLVLTLEGANLALFVAVGLPVSSAREDSEFEFAVPLRALPDEGSRLDDFDSTAKLSGVFTTSFPPESGFASLFLFTTSGLGILDQKIRI